MLLGTSGMGHRESSPRRRLATAARGGVPALFIMGDSTVDVGNNNNLITLAQATFPPYGQDFDTHEPTGRFSNGRLAVDYLVTDTDPDHPRDAASYLDMPLIPAYLLMNSTSDISKGVNFASAGSGILNDTGTIFQLEQFSIVKQRLNEELGATAASRLVAGSIYYISTGSNDFINNYLLPGNPHLDIFPDGYERLLVSSFSDLIKKLYRVGARKIVITSLSPLGCIPSILFKMGSRQGECIGQVNQLVVQYNILLQKELRSLRKHLHGVKLVYNDAYHVFLDIASNATSYGLGSIDQSCCGAGPYGGLKTCSRGFKPCESPKAYFFWDEYHPTSAVYELMAQRFWSGSVKASSPWNIRTLAQM
ncbi:hypothetical protein AXG93_2752s1820 [Marchantia polymorpha subsp. ruderalis]|uniref:GDSL esterase/lipase n=1 Tax=Marchantia polymorpha subsp. ruderalis TaxID=1480154 RepID=A0A176VWB2_MARPO|nr:hypothetical protein AXG93_2752s1820 [Marchantia polymorpha subsp. ruderalis]